MAKAYLIGGAPRIGKSTLTMKLLSQRPAYATSTDALTDILRGVVDKRQVPDLFHSSIGDSPAEAIEWQIKENRIVWAAALDFIHRTIENGFDVIVEGLCVMPETLSQIHHDYVAVFLGNQSDEHFETIKTFAKNNPHDWLNKHTDTIVNDICLFNQAYSMYIEQEAARYKLAYIEINDTSFPESIDKALAQLLG
jgi:2-phosphoglycerate kinase